MVIILSKYKNLYAEMLGLHLRTQIRNSYDFTLPSKYGYYATKEYYIFSKYLLFDICLWFLKATNVIEQGPNLIFSSMFTFQHLGTMF